MSGIVACDEGSFAATFDERPTVGGLEVVVVWTEPVEELENGGMGVGPVLAVVVLQERQAVAALGGAGWIEPLERALLMGVGTPAQMGDADDVFAFGDDGGEEWVFRIDQVADG